MTDHSDTESADLTFTALEAVNAQKALRAALELPPEHFSLGSFIGFIGGEIRQLRAEGKDDLSIATVISKALGIGKRIGAEDISRFCPTSHEASVERGQP